MQSAESRVMRQMSICLSRFTYAAFILLACSVSPMAYAQTLPVSIPEVASTVFEPDAYQQINELTSPGGSLPSIGFNSLELAPTSSTFSRSGFAETDALSYGLNFNEFPKDFVNGITIQKGRWAVKFGGYVKADLIHDFQAIDSTDFFDPSMIPIGGPPRTDSRFHTRQSRLNMDARWMTDSGEPLRFLIEGDFFGAGDTLRLRHAYGEYGDWVVGQTWSTFAHRAALPNTLDSVSDVASVGRRQAQLRWTKKWMEKRWSLSAAVEDSTVRLDDQLNPLGLARSPLPDFISRIRFTGENAQVQLAGIVRQLAFEPTGSNVRTTVGQGLNATGLLDITEKTRLYGGILWGQGIGNYRELPDLALNGTTSGQALTSLAWYSGLSHHWTKQWSSNFTFSEGGIDNTLGQSTSSINRLQYLALNLIWQPTPQTFVGTEYLWGERRNSDFQDSDANRVMISFGFLLP